VAAGGGVSFQHNILPATIFWAGAFICLGFAVALFYEGFAVMTGWAPTISSTVVGQVLTHPRWSYVWVALAFAGIGALAVHFLGWRP
jgi:hypothetical protein